MNKVRSKLILKEHHFKPVEPDPASIGVGMSESVKDQVRRSLFTSSKSSRSLIIRYLP